MDSKKHYEDLLDEGTKKIINDLLYNAYLQGYNQGVIDTKEKLPDYKQGLNDAWEYAKKIIYLWSINDDNMYAFSILFGTWSIKDPFEKFSSSEAIKIIKNFEKECNAKTSSYSYTSEDKPIDYKTRRCDNCKYEHDDGYCDFAKSGGICKNYSGWKPKIN